MTPSGHFRVHFDRRGRHAVPVDDSDGNGVPDYVDRVAVAADSAWILEVETLGYRPPPGDSGQGGGSEYDLYLVQMSTVGGGQYYGLTYPEGAGTTSGSYIEIDNDFQEATYTSTRGLQAMRVTVAHEFFHAIQFGYYQGTDGIWWQEAASTWMEDVAYPEVDDYLQYLSSFLLHPEKALDGGNRFATDFRIYGASIWAHFLDQRYGRSTIRLIWEEMGRHSSASMEQFDRVLQDQDRASLGAAVSQFAVWNYFTGTRSRPGYYVEGWKYPEVRVEDVHIDPGAPEVPAERSLSIDHLGSAYVRLQPDLLSGGVTLDYSGDERSSWSRQLILVGRDSVTVRGVAAKPVVVPSWDRFDDIVLVLTVTSDTGFGYNSDIAVAYDPDLLGEPAPQALRLQPSYPNPFRLERDALTTFHFDLNEPSPVTFLSVFGADGRLVRRFAMGGLAARQGHTQTWDGTNEAGETVASGIYLGVLEASGRHVRTTLAVIRGSGSAQR
ncbi:MAG: MXAN_6640 family putative metalloprotease [Candidatus Latescibacterota bacterium]